MTTRRQATSPGGKQNRSVFLSFEFEKDAGRQRAFLSEAKEHCEFAIIDKSLPSAEHDDTWRREAKARSEGPTSSSSCLARIPIMPPALKTS